ncbi:adenylate/guanylate cyclase domain-containing protein [Pseudohalioglobus lutimaris]|uniref:Adenylate/guanylate cyclase domain-containing response regulator n=1 Tax=Pseudohalioglobus lutimaris TaxID=1737061 RepID=A0A2N5X728_9GAMM|nr:adenylate/guanylate cyclase domain-containing protein [Pseudohalioglobus lutimaris]PLW70280.1 adenylate/guanylate cyclase domain-containing response regulator [Pseudohalioglobus lutimaris]
MTSGPSKSTAPWSDLLLRNMAELRELYNHASDQFDEDAQADFARLFDGSSRMDEMLRDADSSRHDLMNVLSAVRGYSEILREDLSAEHADIDAALARLLKAVDSANSDSDSTPARASSRRIIHSEPGFILAVDDLQENRELAARYLSRSGHIVVTAASGEEALLTLDQADVDVVLLDLMMPGMDGHEVLRRIKEHPEWRATPVIVISGRQDMDGIIECIEAGADDYLFKPFNPVLLQARIKAGIERKRWHDREELYRQQLERNEKFIRATFGRYLSDEIVTDILERPEGLELGGDLRRVTIMMADIRGFTTISERLAPAQVVTLINRYLGAMTDIIMAHQGTIDEFIGDAILAVFGAPQHRDDDADRAVRCALAMQQAMEEINQRNREDGLPEISTGIALNTGDVIAGNIGSERRSKYGFVGHPMNVTSRIEDVTAGGEILIAGSTLESLQREYRVGQSRELNVKGIDELLQVYPLLGEQS